MYAKHVQLSQRGLKPLCAYRLHHRSPTLLCTCGIFRFYIVMAYSETLMKVILFIVGIECSGPVVRCM